MAKKTTHNAVLAALIPADERDAHQARVDALVARNRFLEVIEELRISEDMTKLELASRAGLDYASVRRLLTAKTANPTADTIIKLMSALGVKLDAVLPGGKHLSIV